ncbi:MAG: ribosome-associated translation inhibitor RaiA [Deltaproteobacteria bacterium]|nr:ribosome-associated translation inhibitor RaiA [Deltaproteobacteria bacterium]
MQISVTFRQLEPSEALKNYVTERLKKFRRYLEGPIEAHVVLGLEKFRHLADVTLNSNGRIIKGREENVDMYAAIDLVVDKLDMQLKKLRERLREVKPERGRGPAPAGFPEEEASLPSLRRQRVEVTPLRVVDAVELLQRKDRDLVVFTEVSTGALSILYRRADGSLVLVEPEMG